MAALVLSALTSPAPGELDPGFHVADGLELTLSAGEPDVVSLCNIDVDHRGRVWACEVVNYRPNRGKRKEGDRILIMEDRDGDGKMDRFKTFYQGTDIDAAMGLCVLADRVIVSVTPKVWVLFDDDGDDRADRKELLFSGDGVEQHDHSYHSLVFGPDGKMYWNFGNTGRNLKDRNGKILVDVHGRPVSDKGKPFWGGMVFRCDLNGGALEVLGHNFRNNYEVTVDSFGSPWQSDNDDDGNRATRINFIVEGGNYGYLDERTGGGWRKARSGMHEDVSLRHWHLNDPGVVPNVLQTGAGAPAGITVYEGRLLPRAYWGGLIHCESGVNVVRLYQTQKQGAGYKAKSLPIFAHPKDKSFRPIDVAVAPDGSLFVSDWYDPVVGGFQQRDIARGRLYRVAPEGVPYTVPEFDFATPEGAVEALKNANYCARGKAWRALNSMGAGAEDELLKLYRSSNPRHRARALWLLGNIAAKAKHYTGLALKDADADIRLTAVRLARQKKLDLVGVIGQLAGDPSAHVRRECAVALTHLDSPEKAGLWSKLASLHDGKDRWYLEALGIAAGRSWEACFTAWLRAVGDNWNTPGGRDIIWRSRSVKAPALLARILQDPSTPKEERPRYFRALDFHEGAEKQAALQAILGQDESGGRPPESGR